ncbi:MAG: hypothetical protein HETSPECPRED_006287 [Heterodermia speciosa]|uniref:Uncharacterized protein n=1 Tax=Heterodermia speciosa TaxID=116794 RepID=A0A8H3FKK6_9LECA|nr:MAG: hypothetical protein HETSPECPRED_006287 [Heterodermia speciosa]
MPRQSTNLGTLILTSFTLFSLVSTANIPKVRTAPTPHTSNPLSSNSSILTIPIDRRFTIQTAATGNPLDPTACKMVALQFMGELALLDWESSLTGTASPITAYPSVFIYGGAGVSASLTRSKYLIWGLCLAMGEFIRRSRFVETQFNLVFEGHRVGILQFQRLGLREGRGVEARSAADEVGLRGSGDEMGQKPPRSEALNVMNQPIRIQPVLITGSQPLDPDQVWLALYATIQTLAFPDKDTILVEPFEFEPVHTNVKILITSHHGSSTPKHQPPFLLYSVIIEALRQLPTWLLSPQGSFKETMFGIFEGDVFLGGGSCKWRWRRDFLTMGDGLNVSVV